MNTIILPYTTEPFTACPAFPEKSSITRPIVLTYLEYDGKTLPFKFGSIIDSGADTCVFPALFGEKIGIPVRDGKPLDTKGIGSDTAYYHMIKVCVELNCEIFRFECWAGFMYSLDTVGKGLLGRHGFFELFRSVSFNKEHVELIPVKAPVNQPMESLPL